MEEFKQGKRYNFISEFYEKYNHLPRPIVKSANNRLLDGFLVLLFAKENQIEQIPCIKIENVYREGITKISIIFGIKQSPPFVYLIIF